MFIIYFQTIYLSTIIPLILDDEINENNEKSNENSAKEIILQKIDEKCKKCNQETKIKLGKIISKYMLSKPRQSKNIFRAKMVQNSKNVPRTFFRIR